MKISSTLRRLVPVVAVVITVLLASCASSSKKYGCPNHLQASASWSQVEYISYQSEIPKL